MEKVPGLIKSGLQSVLEISHWSGRQVEVDSGQIETLRTINVYGTWEIANITKISKSTKLLVKMKNLASILWK